MQVAHIWTYNTCGDGVCDRPFEYPSFGPLPGDCQADCGSHTVVVGPLYKALLVLQGNFQESPLGAGSGVNLASTVEWNLCRREEVRVEAGLTDECWYRTGQKVELQVAQTFHYNLPAGEWYVDIVGDYYHILQGRLYDANNATRIRELSVSPAWDTCEVCPHSSTAQLVPT